MNSNLNQINNPEEINKNVITTEDNSSGSALQNKVTAANTDDANVLLDNGLSATVGSIAAQLARTHPITDSRFVIDLDNDNPVQPV